MAGTAPTTFTCRISKMTHNLSKVGQSTQAPTGLGWTVTLHLRDQNVVQQPHRLISTEVAHNPDGTVYNEALDVNAVDGMTITPANTQTKATGNRIVMRDDGSEG